MTKLSVLLPTYNEEAMIEDCIKSVRWADEILVVDSYSTDITLDIAREYGARIIQHETDHLNGILFVDRLSSVKRQLLAKTLEEMTQAGDDS